MEEGNKLSYLVDDYAIILFLMLIGILAQHGIFVYSNNTQRLSIDVPNVGYVFGEMESVIRGKKMKMF